MNDKARSLLEAARRELARRKPKKAARYMDQAVEADPDAPELLAERAAMAISPLREYRKAVEDLTRALGFAPANARLSSVGAYYDMRGQAYWYLREYERALEDFNRAIEVDARCASAYYHRGNFHDKLQRYEQAIDDMRRAVELEPQNLNYKRRLDELKRAAIRTAERVGEEPPAAALEEPGFVEEPAAAKEGLALEEPETVEETEEPVPVAPVAEVRAEPGAPEEPAEPEAPAELEAPAEPEAPGAEETAAIGPAAGLWSVRIPRWGTFGPVSIEVLKLWARELRVKADDELLRPDGGWVPVRSVPEVAVILEELRTTRKPPVRPD